VNASPLRLAEKREPYVRDSGRHVRLGQRGEEAAERHLVDAGYRILERRYRTRTAEIDFIAEDGDVLVFVEVKTRSSLLFGRPCEAVDGRKRARIALAASHYLARHGAADRACRFDVVEILESAGRPGRVRLIRDAFEAD
jgi:putative endonuclease